MKTEIVKIWVSALRSGEYTQGSKCLLNEQGEYCCLGVLCDLYNKANAPNQVLGTFSEGNKQLPTRVMEWAGIATPNAYYDKTSLIQQNDGTEFFPRVSFDGIATIIERHQEEL